MLSITGMTLEQFSDLMGGLGYRGEKAERPKHRPEVAVPMAEAVSAEAVAGTASLEADLAQAEPLADVAPMMEAPVMEAAVAEAATAEPAIAEALPTEAPDAEAPDAEAPIAESAPAEAEASPEAAAALPVEMEAFYTFTWAPRPRGGESRGPRRERNEQRGRGPQATPQADGQPAAAPREDRPARNDRPPRGDRPQGERRQDGAPKDRNEGFKGKPKGKGGKPHDRPNDRPHDRQGDRPRDTQPKTFEARPPRDSKIDPDNPFAVLAALKTRS
jgi:ATP-dependent RNA helicase SUPV3L1/SUV3